MKTKDRIPKPLLVGALLAAITLIVFLPVRNHDFTIFDDDIYVTENHRVRAGLTTEGVSWAFTTTEAANWHPLTWLSHMLDMDLFGLSPGGHHLTNVILHVLNSLLLFATLRRMTGATWRSGFVAALFAVHPLHVESVAWISERKDVLSTLLWMSTLIAYLRYAERPGPSRYSLLTVCFALGLLAKPMLVTLPFVLLLLDYWPLGRFAAVSGPVVPRRYPDVRIRHILLEKVPLALLAGGSVVVTYICQAKGRAVASYPLLIRIGNAIDATGTYLFRTAWPRDLVAFYPHPGSSLSGWRVTLSGLLLAGITYGVIRRMKRFPFLCTGWFWYLGTLVPVIGLVQVGAQATADRYTYIPLIGIFIIISWSASELTARLRYRKQVLGIAAGLVLSILMAVSRVQVGYWRDSTTLFRHALEVSPNNWMAHSILGTVLGQQGRIDEAMAHLRESLRTQPAFAYTHNSMGKALMQRGDIAGALSQFQEALLYNDRDPMALYNAGVALALLGRPEEAAQRYRESLRARPDNPMVHTNLGNLLLGQGRVEEAAGHYRRAIAISPGDARIRYNLGVVSTRQGNIPEAIRHYREAIRIQPDYADAHTNLGNLLLSGGGAKEAIVHYREAARILPGVAMVHYNLGMALRKTGAASEAADQFRIAFRLRPDDPELRRRIDEAMSGR